MLVSNSKFITCSKTNIWVLCLVCSVLFLFIFLCGAGEWIHGCALFMIGKVYTTQLCLEPQFCCVH